jgi:hypothetical protein
MHFSSSVAERAIWVVNRLMIAAMTSAWTSTLTHQHILQLLDDDDSSSGETSSQQEDSAEADY